MKIYAQILGKYSYLPLNGAPIEENPMVIYVEANELNGIGTSTKFDMKTLTIVPIEQNELRKKEIKERLSQIEEKLNAQDYIHCRQMRERALLAENKISALSMSEADYIAFCEIQQTMLDEYHTLEVEYKELTLFE